MNQTRSLILGFYGLVGLGLWVSVVLFEGLPAIFYGGVILSLGLALVPEAIRDWRLSAAPNQD